MTTFEGADAGPEDPFVAVTVKVYAVPFVSPKTGHESPLEVQVLVPS
jgi:hypothetical protein